jgi:hypothetical protein
MTEKGSFVKRYGLLFALFGFCLIATPSDLPVAGKRMLGLLAFSVILWMTGGVSFPVSAAVITSLMAFLIGTSRPCRAFSFLPLRLVLPVWSPS